jgi:hypothetical protein
MDLFRIIPFIHDIEVRMSDLVTLLQEFFCVRDRWCHYYAVNSAPASKEIISLFTDQYRLPVIQSSLISMRINAASLVNDASLVKAPTFVDPLTELLDRGEMGYFGNVDLLSKRIHNLDKFCNFPVIFSQVFFEEKKNERLVQVQGIGLF